MFELLDLPTRLLTCGLEYHPRDKFILDPIAAKLDSSGKTSPQKFAQVSPVFADIYLSLQPSAGQNYMKNKFVQVIYGFDHARVGGRRGERLGVRNKRRAARAERARGVHRSRAPARQQPQRRTRPVRGARARGVTPALAVLELAVQRHHEPRSPARKRARLRRVCVLVPHVVGGAPMRTQAAPGQRPIQLHAPAQDAVSAYTDADKNGGADGGAADADAGCAGSATDSIASARDAPGCRHVAHRHLSKSAGPRVARGRRQPASRAHLLDSEALEGAAPARARVVPSLESPVCDRKPREKSVDAPQRDGRH
ncbi:hypothetical protein GGX14DRAFT_660827 [Mycena pura]|uniref:Uncharacterized protein n=1 Tax=Mycena pura TaxID=153505 RepID=A0AAD6V0P0_9AGAR|nr:hypothetical protein GGX14DRAFT_660827 [Mycena pura]